MQNEINTEEVAGRIKTARRLAGLSQREAAAQLDVTEKTIARWEAAETEGFLGELERIAKVYGTTPEAILGTDGSDDQVAAQLAAMRAELDELKTLLLDPKLARKRADALMDEEGVKPKRRRS